jgi:hypothetical protein
MWLVLTHSGRSSVLSANIDAVNNFFGGRHVEATLEFGFHCYSSEGDTMHMHTPYSEYSISIQVET